MDDWGTVMTALHTKDEIKHRIRVNKHDVGRLTAGRDEARSPEAKAEYQRGIDAAQMRLDHALAELERI